MAIYLMLPAGMIFVWLFKKLVSMLHGSHMQAPYPPGPVPKPFIGNTFDFPTENAAQVYAQWGKKYNSPLLHASSLGNHILIVNGLEDAYQLFEKRARKYSDRPLVPVIEVMGWENIVSLLPYGDDWRFHRKLCQQSFRLEAARDFQPLQRKRVHALLHGLLTNPNDFDGHNKMLSVSLAMASMYGYEVKSFEDPCIAAANESISLGATLLVPGASFMNILPALRHIPAWFPGATASKAAAKVRRLTDEMRKIPLEFVKNQFEEGVAPPSFFAQFLERKVTTGSSGHEEKAIENIAHTVYGAASDTTISATMTFLYLMAVNPDVQRKAQAEIDRVIGSERLPGFEDRSSQTLPYVEAVYREVMRWKPSLPLGVPHCLSEDDYYKGYFIPKGTTVFSNIWAMTHDESLYPDPFTFKPERFLDEHGRLTDDDKILAYGFGRRICVGRYIASSTVWMTIVSVLACFNITKAKDEHGNEIEINDDYEDCGVINHKTRFQCSFSVRFPGVEKLIVGAN